MPNILFYTSGFSGIGRLVHGIAIRNAFKRNGIEVNFKILHSAPTERHHLLERSGINHTSLPPESPASVSKKNLESSELYQAIVDFDPEIFIVDRMWMTVKEIFPALKCKKVFISSQVIDDFFKVDTVNGNIYFDPGHYDRCIGIEPFESAIDLHHIEPLIIKNHDEILTREEALEELEKIFGAHIRSDKSICFMGANFKKGTAKILSEKYSYLNDEYSVIKSTNMTGGGLFPIADFYNAIDFMICSATYNFFWEARFFQKEAVFETVPVRFCDQEKRLAEYSSYTPNKNGADQFVEILMNLS